MATFKKILVPTDFSPCSAAAQTMAEELARTTGAELILLNVVDDTSRLMGDMTGYVSAQELAQAEEVAKERIAQCAAQARCAGLSVTGKVVHGVADRAITDSASTSEADLIVMGSHGFRGFRHLILGSVAERVVRTSCVPVMVVRDAPSKA